MKQSGASRKILWGMQIALILLLIGAGIVLFRFSGRDSFRDIVSGKSFEDSREFTRQFTRDICDAISYTNLADRFETDGSLDVDKVVLRGKDENGQTVSYTLKNAIDYGQTAGIYFDARNHLVVRDPSGSAAQKLAGGADQETDVDSNHSGTSVNAAGEDGFFSEESDRSAEVNGDFPIVFSSDLNSANATIDEETSLLSLLSQLAEYYELREYLGIDSSQKGDFRYRVILGDESGTALSTNDDSLMQTSVPGYGRYVIISSDRKSALSNLPSGRSSDLMETLRSNNLLSDARYEILAVVDTSYTEGETYAIQSHEYRQFSRAIRGVAAFVLVLFVFLCISIIQLALNDHRRIYEEDTASAPRGVDSWYAEFLIVIAVLAAASIYWSFAEFRYGLQAHSALDIAAGTVLFLLGYFPAEGVVLSLLRRHWSGRLAGSFFFYRGVQSVREGYASRNDVWRTGRSVLRALIVVTVAAGLALAAGIFLGRKEMGAGAALLVLLGIVVVNVLLSTLRTAKQRKIIYERVRHLAEGEVGTKIDTSKMTERNRYLAETVNALDDSLENAVRERTAEERARTELIANVSHDLRTPLTSIISYVDLIRRENIPNPHVQEYLRILDEKAMRLKTMAEELMDASRAASGDLNIQWQRIDMVQMIYQVQGEFQDRLASKKLTPVLRMPDHPAYIIADGKLMWRVLDNLYVNVCKYAQTETPVLVELQQTAKNYVFTMKNVSAEPLKLSSEQLEERFVRGDSSRSTEGSGLGLAIAKSMTEQLGGQFELFPDEDMFRVRLIFPAAGAEEEAEGGK